MIYGSYLSGMAYGAGDAPVITAPTYIASGTAGNTGTTSVAPAYGTNAVDDLFVMQLFVRNQTVAPTTPSGWTLQAGPDNLDGRYQYVYTRDARSTGSEAGTVTVNVTGNCLLAQIHTFRGVAGSSFIEGVNYGGSASNVTSILAVQVNALSTGRLAVAMVCFGNNAVTGIASFAGASGGTWETRTTATSSTGNNGCINMQTAEIDDTTIIGGAYTISPAESYVVHGFALVGGS